MLQFVPVLRTLCGILSIPGCETRAAAHLKKEFGPCFDAVETDAARNQIFLKYSKKPGPHPRLMLDAHFDEVGMIVSEITERGFLRLMPVGGLDKKLLPAARVWVYPDADADGENTPESDAAKRLPGAIGYVPSELILPGEKTPDDWNTFLCDIGASSADEVRALGIGIGTPVGCMDAPEALLGTRIKGRAFDDKSCAAALLCAAANIPAEELDYDIVLTLSSGEEVGGGGARSAAHRWQPDLALIADVNFATTPGVDEEESGPYGGGPSISLSAVCDRPLTADLLALAEKYGVPATTTLDPTSTGTNASSVVYAREGVPAAVLGIPIGGMHSSAEVLDLRDAEQTIRLLTLFMGGADPGPVPEKTDGEKGGEEPDARPAVSPEKTPVAPLAPDADLAGLLRDLAGEFGPSGCEGRTAEKIRGFAELFADEVTKDRLGSVIAVIRKNTPPEAYDDRSEPSSGTAPDCSRLLLTAHMDEPGFMLKPPNGSGYLRPAELSVREPMTLNAENVWVGNEERLTKGYFCVKPAHLGGSGDFDSLTVDIGAGSKEEAENYAKKGDFGAFRGSPLPLGPSKLMGKALSGRSSCAVLLDLLRRVSREKAGLRLPFDLYFVFTTRELIGASSAAAAAWKLGADAVWLFDGLAADDTRDGAGKRYGASADIGAGAAIPYMDRGAIFDRELTAFLGKTAEKSGIPCQPYRFSSPRSDAGAFNLAGEGARCAMIGLPVRNRLTASEIVDTRDLEAVRSLAWAALLALAEG